MQLITKLNSTPCLINKTGKNVTNLLVKVNNTVYDHSDYVYAPNVEEPLHMQNGGNIIIYQYEVDNKTTFSGFVYDTRNKHILPIPKPRLQPIK